MNVFFVFDDFSVWVMMNKKTRRLSKIPPEVRGEIEPYFMDSTPVVEEDSRKLQKLGDNTADYVRTGLSVSFSFNIISQLPFHFLYFKILFGLLLTYCFLIIIFSLCNLQPRWSDLDVNQHVNNVKYIGWILEVVVQAKLNF